jgi:hypothetical protein
MSGVNMSITREQIEALEKISGQIEGLHRELTALARKSPNDAVNKFKLKFLNGALSDANAVLGDVYRPLEGFERFDDDDLPSNSDVTFILAQYLEELERLRADNIKIEMGKWVYKLSGSEKIRTAPPKKISEKKNNGSSLLYDQG